MKKILIVSTVSRQFYLFERGNIEVLKSLGYEVHAAANFSDANERLEGLDLVKHHFDIQRSPFSVKNLKAYRQLKSIIEAESFDVIHCHSPMGGVIGRLVANTLRVPKVLYTAHGFHFYKGAPFINNLIYKNIEQLLAKKTDILLTMNEEDFKQANKFNLKNQGEVVYIPGVGVDTRSIVNCKVNTIDKREELGIPNDAFLVISIGELIDRKNHKQGLEAIALLKKMGVKNLHYAICGQGILKEELQALSTALGIEEHVHFLGYRNDIVELLKISDLFLFPSIQEGLPKSVMESMAAGLPVIATNIRGNTDLIEDELNGFIVNIGDVNATALAIEKIYENKKMSSEMSKSNLNKIKEFDIDNVNRIMRNIYNSI
jgi:glycosyltransferase involved in cell wall biosynthesis